MDLKTYQGGLCINRTVYIWCIQLFKVTIVMSQLPELDEVDKSKPCVVIYVKILKTHVLSKVNT